MKTQNDFHEVSQKISQSVDRFVEGQERIFIRFDDSDKRIKSLEIKVTGVDNRPAIVEGK